MAVLFVRLCVDVTEGGRVAHPASLISPFMASYPITPKTFSGPFLECLRKKQPFHKPSVCSFAGLPDATLFLLTTSACATRAS